MTTRGMILGILIAGSACDGSMAIMDSGHPNEDAGPVDSGHDDAGVPQECHGPPGLYIDGRCDLAGLAPGVRPFHPHYALWSDGAEKERFVLLPPGTTIDTTDPDRWVFPQGTTFFKTFSLNGQRLETRVLQKVGNTPGAASWMMTSYAWSADGLSVTEDTLGMGMMNVLGTEHDIPSRAQCVRCHSITQADSVNGFSAIQLNHNEDGVTLSTLLDEGLLMNPAGIDNVTLGTAVLPGDSTAQAALGYLHANCGNCHGGAAPPAGVFLWARVQLPGSGIGGTMYDDVMEEPIWDAAVCQRTVGWFDITDPRVYYRIEPAMSMYSEIIRRMSTRVASDQMPPIGTEITHPEGIATVSAWIDSLDPSQPVYLIDHSGTTRVPCPPPATTSAP